MKTQVLVIIRRQDRLLAYAHNQSRPKQMVVPQASLEKVDHLFWETQAQIFAELGIRIMMEDLLWSHREPDKMTLVYLGRVIGAYTMNKPVDWLAFNHLHLSYWNDIAHVRDYVVKTLPDMLEMRNANFHRYGSFLQPVLKLFIVNAENQIVLLKDPEQPERWVLPTASMDSRQPNENETKNLMLEQYGISQYSLQYLGKHQNSMDQEHWYWIKVSAIQSPVVNLRTVLDYQKQGLVAPLDAHIIETMLADNSTQKSE